MSNSKRRESQLMRHYLDCFLSLRKLIMHEHLRIDVSEPFVWLSSDLFACMFFDGISYNPKKALSFLDNVRTYINFLRRGRETPLPVVADESPIRFLVVSGGRPTHVGEWVRVNVVVRNYVTDEEKQ